MKYILSIAVVLCSVTINAQPSGVEDNNAVNFNQIKLNLTAIPFNNYSVQYERIISKKGSFAISLRYMPESKLPFQSLIRKSVIDEDPELQRTMEKLRISNFAITPEYRFYLGKGYGHGFYVSPFYRYAMFKSNNILINYTNDILGNEETVNLSGDLNSHTFGIAVGVQWLLSKNISLDWMIAGPHFGSGNGNFIGLSSRTLSTGDQQSVREELERLDIPFTKKTITTNPQGATMKLDGPWGGIRTGISIGVHF